MLNVMYIIYIKYNAVQYNNSRKNFSKITELNAQYLISNLNASNRKRKWK